MPDLHRSSLCCRISLISFPPWENVEQQKRETAGSAPSVAAHGCTTSWNILKHHDIWKHHRHHGGITAPSSPWPWSSRPFRCWTTQRPLRWALAHGGTRPEALGVSKTDMHVTCMWHACDMQHDILFTLRFDILWLDYDILSLCANKKKCKNLGASLQICKVSHPFSLSLALCLTHDVNVTARAFHKGHIVALSVEAKRSHFEGAHGVLVVKRWNGEIGSAVDLSEIPGVPRRSHTHASRTVAILARMQCNEQFLNG